MPVAKIPQYDFQAIPLSPDDLLQIETIAVSFPITIEIEGTALDKSGRLVPFRFIQSISATVTPTTNQFRLGYQALLSVVIHTRTSKIPDGDCYCRLTLVKSLTRSVYPHRKLLVEGYVTTYASIGYGSPSIDGLPRVHRYTDNILITPPIVGNTVLYTVPPCTSLRVLSLGFTFVTDANVANRYIQLRLTRPSGANLFVFSNLSIPADTTVIFSCFHSVLNTTSLINGYASFPLPPLFLENADSFRIIATNMQATDTFSDINMRVQRQTVPYTG